ncbi:MAG: hypothetical protein KGH62_05010, partial [Candidatus Micrarchaeota archaeon]|nr:hypothetical protein [Candidatus Micrarchaeota archaeon]
PILTIATNPTNYGINDQISATTFPLLDNVIIYINSTIVANATENVNYTVCSNGVCLKPGTYAITAYDTVNKESASQYLLVKPIAPTFNIQKASVDYGQGDAIVGTSAFYNDSLGIYIDGQQVALANGTVKYTICGNYFVNTTLNEPCLAAGTHNVSVEDLTQGIYATANKTLTIKPVLPTIKVPFTSVKYGKIFNITAIPPVYNDTLTILVSNYSIANGSNSARLLSGTGTITYPVCNSTQQPCLAPSLYYVYASDSSENVNSSPVKLLVSPVGVKLKVNKTQLNYGLPDQLSATAPNPNDTIAIFADGVQISPTGNGNVLYTICNPVTSTPCLQAGTHTLYAHDAVENLSSGNVSIMIEPVAPSISISAFNVNYSVPITVNGSAPFYNDSLSILINNITVQNGTGKVSYTICANGQSYTCLLPGRYSVSLYDNSEGLGSGPRYIQILGSHFNGSGSTTVYTATTSVPHGPRTTTSIPASGSGGANYGEIAAAVIIIIIIFGIITYIRRQREDTYAYTSKDHSTQLATQDQDKDNQAPSDSNDRPEIKYTKDDTKSEDKTSPPSPGNSNSK